MFLADLITFTEEILNEKIHFLCSVSDLILFYSNEKIKEVPFLSHAMSNLTIHVSCLTLIQYLGSGFSRGPISGARFFLRSSSGSGDSE